MGSGAFSEFLEKMLEKGCGFKVARGREKRYTFNRRSGGKREEKSCQGMEKARRSLKRMIEAVSCGGIVIYRGKY